jgi:RecJ-like exonuclease
MPKQRCEVCRGKGICSTCHGACGTCHATGEIEIAPVPKKGTRVYNKYMNDRAAPGWRFDSKRGFVKVASTK